MSIKWDEQVVLVTGGTGSFGRKFIEIMLNRYQPRKLIVFSRDELKQFEMQQLFRPERYPNIRYFIGDVRDRDRLWRAFDSVDIVVHAAALKQVPTAEYNPLEAIKTNVLGAANIIDAAIDRNVRRVIALSTDKAANPINLYGATKLCADKLFIAANVYSGAHRTRMSVVRYGNVVGSRGSVIPLFIQQRTNGTITVTDTRMTRFWITLEQGVEFVLKCIGMMRGGEIFVPKIASMRITDLVEAVAPGCRVELTGIRPGEKIHEVLVSEDEAHHTIEFDDMYLIRPLHPWWMSEEPWKDGKPLSDGARFASNTNTRWLSVDELRRLLA